MTAAHNKTLRGVAHIHIGGDYTTEQVRFMLAMYYLKRRLRRMPTEKEVFAEAIRLGYRKTEPKT